MDYVKILGIDPGTASTGIGLIDGNIRTCEAFVVPDWCKTIKTSIEDGDVRERIDAIGIEIANIVTCTTPDFVVIEDFTEQGKRTGTVYKEMSWLVEHLRMTCRHLADTTIYENAEWKKLATGSKGLNKEQVKHFVANKISGTEAFKKRTPSHVWDACGMAYAKLKQLQGVR